MNGRYLKSQKGQNLIEFAVILPIFVFMVLGVIDLSRAIYVSYVMHRLSREGANLATRPGTWLYERVRTTMQESARPLTMSSNGAIYIYKINAIDDNVAQVVEANREPTQRVESMLGRSATTGYRLTDDQLDRVMNGQRPFPRGQVIVLVEAYYLHSNVTPVEGLISFFLPQSQRWALGSKAVFYLN
jgi:hypothetical protein